MLGLVFAAAWLGIAYWLWPQDAISRPGGAIGSMVSVLIGVVGALWVIEEGCDLFR
jgi:hypothetical protein